MLITGRQRHKWPKLCIIINADYAKNALPNVKNQLRETTEKSSKSINHQNLKTHMKRLKGPSRLEDKKELYKSIKRKFTHSLMLMKMNLRIVFHLYFTGGKKLVEKKMSIGTIIRYFWEIFLTNCVFSARLLQVAFTKTNWADPKHMRNLRPL